MTMDAISNTVKKPSIIAPRVLEHAERVRFVAWAQMLECALSLVEKAGEAEVNPGIKDAVGNSVRPYITDLDDFTVALVCGRAVRVGDKALRGVAAPNEVSRCLGVAYCILKLVEEKIIDSESTLAAAALGIVLESEDENDQVWKDAKNPKGLAKEIWRKFEQEWLKP